MEPDVRDGECGISPVNVQHLATIMANSDTGSKDSKITSVINPLLVNKILETVKEVFFPLFPHL
jgi:hypothetical protein